MDYTGPSQEKAPHRKSLQGLIFTQSGRRDLNATAPMRGRCFIGTYVHKQTASVGIGKYGTANITAKRKALPSGGVAVEIGRADRARLWKKFGAGEEKSPTTALVAGLDLQTVGIAL